MGSLDRRQEAVDENGSLLTTQGSLDCKIFHRCRYEGQKKRELKALENSTGKLGEAATLRSWRKLPVGKAGAGPFRETGGRLNKERSNPDSLL